MAHALSRPGLGPRQGARHALQHRRRHPHGARDRRQPVRQLVGLPRRAVGDERAGVRRPRGRRPVPEAQLSVRASWSTPPASASSTRAPTSATTPTRSTAAWCWSSRASSPGRCSTRRSKHLQRDEYRIRQITKVTANTLEELAQKLEGVNAERVPQDRRRVQHGGAQRHPVQSERQGRPLHRRASRSTSRTGRTRSIRRPSRPTR